PRHPHSHFRTSQHHPLSRHTTFMALNRDCYQYLFLAFPTSIVYFASNLIFIVPMNHVSFLFFFFQSSADHRDLHSFPTRRSSDLEVGGKGSSTRRRVAKSCNGLERIVGVGSKRAAWSRCEANESRQSQYKDCWRGFGVLRGAD